ncbi:fibrous sheath CABYR-binding protein-like isoform X1 [Macrobrachium rosenbergii]|uniref:fibrous sheath CABYR-binding protein-like isoform X1 n=2 Tax=Macrobrachium TaxID=6696 RepID=UPI0034D55A78
MGAAQSTRKITLVEDDKAGVIKLSETLAQRLRGQIEGQQAAAAAAAAAAVAAQKAEQETAQQEPLHVSPPPPPQAPILPTPPPSFIEKPLPISPEPPKVPEVVPIPEPPKVPDVTPLPEPPKVSAAPEPVVQEPPEPLVSEPPAFLGEFLPPDSVDVEPSLPLSSENVPSDETSLSVSVQSPPPEPAQIEAVDDTNSQISEPKQSVETEVFELDSPASVEEIVAFPADSAEPPVTPVVEGLSAVEEAVIAGKVIEAVLPSPETLLSAAFASDPIDTTQSAPIESVGQVPVPVVPPVALVEEAVPTQILPEAPSPPDVSVAVRAGPSPTLTQPAGNIPPWSIYAEEAHLMVMRLREEKEQEIKKLNQDWRDKLDAREKEFIKMARLSEDQVASTLKEVEGLFMKASCSPVCQNHQDAVMHCYQDHPRQSLRCAREVEQFAQCVDLSRLQSVMKQEAH